MSKLYIKIIQTYFERKKCKWYRKCVPWPGAEPEARPEIKPDVVPGVRPQPEVNPEVRPTVESQTGIGTGSLIYYLRSLSGLESVFLPCLSSGEL